MQVDEPISPSFGFSSSMELSWPYHIKIFSVRKSVLSRRFIGFIGWILDISLVKLVEFLIRDWFDWLNYAVPLACLLNAACLEFCFILNYFFITVLDRLMSVTTWYDYFYNHDVISISKIDERCLQCSLAHLIIRIPQFKIKGEILNGGGSKVISRSKSDRGRNRV